MLSDFTNSFLVFIRVSNIERVSSTIFITIDNLLLNIFLILLYP